MAHVLDFHQPLADRAIVIVGGTTGLGLSAAKACVRAGASVVVMGRSAESVQQASEVLSAIGEAVALQGDACEAGSAERAIALCVEMFGRFDGLYHVAGGSGRRFGDGPLHDVTDKGIEATVSLNLSSMIRSNRAAVRAWRCGGAGRSPSGAVLNMGSVLGVSPSPRHFATHVYAATKSAVIGLTRSCAAYYAADNIRFNVIAPALVETPMAQRAATDPTIQAFVSRKQPLDGGRVGQPEDLDAAVVYLLGAGAACVTGQVLCVDGGWCVSEGLSAEAAVEGGQR
ncbi:MAG: SDR family oxidoreductase [Planctomycetota bacterium]